MIKNAIVIGSVLNPAEYFKLAAPRGEIGFEMSVSQLKEFAVCASRWRDGYERPGSDSLAYGSLFDTMALTSTEFDKRYAIRPETYKDTKTGEIKDWHASSKVCKAWLAEHAKLIPVSVSEHQETLAAVSRLYDDSIIGPFLDVSAKQVVVKGEWHDPKTGIVIPVKCMIDALPSYDSEFYKSVGDLKSTVSGAPLRWNRTVFNFKYHWQAAFYMDMYQAAKPDEDRSNFCHLVQENFAPYQPARYIMSHAFLELGRREYRKALANYCWCLDNKRWPDYNTNDESVQGWSISEPTPWMETDGMFAPKFGSEAPESENESNDIIP
jgi:hypothetical protein